MLVAALDKNLRAALNYQWSVCESYSGAIFTFLSVTPVRDLPKYRGGDLSNDGTCTENSPAQNQAPGTIVNSAKTALFNLWCRDQTCGVKQTTKWIDTTTVLLSEVPAWAWADLLCGSNLWSSQKSVL